MEETNTTELDSMQIILHAGNAKSDAYEALAELKKGNTKIYKEKIQSAKDEIKLAHQSHANILRNLSSENKMKEVDLLLVHAEGHLSSTSIAVDLIEEIAELHLSKGR
nr:PTS lactose/cellobiose transporter subunit IIA [Enterococcus cecorum]